jgi:hypothetical protein
MINWIVLSLIDIKIQDDCKKGKKRKNRIPLFINCIIKSEKVAEQNAFLDYSTVA